jgi:hypothetical protein
MGSQEAAQCVQDMPLGVSIPIYIWIFLLSIAFLYDQTTKRVLTRLRGDQAPKSGFGLVPAGTACRRVPVESSVHNLSLLRLESAADIP